MSKSRIRVLEFCQILSDEPRHRIPRRLADAIVLDRNAVVRRPDLIQLTTKVCFATVRLSAKKRLLGNPDIVIASPLPGFEDGAAMGYGHWPTGSDQSSYSKQHFIETWTLRG